MKKIILSLGLGLVLMGAIQSCQKDVSPTGPNPTPTSNQDSIIVPYAIVWTDTGFASPGTESIGALYDAQNRVSQVNGSNVFVKSFYYPDGRLSHVMADSKKNAGGRERNSAVFKYSGNKIVKAIYKYNSTLPETDSYYSDTLRTDNLTGYYDSLRYDVNNNLTEIYHKYNFGGTPGTAYTFKIKYPGGSDSTFIIDQTSATNGLEYRISGKISNQANPYKPYFSLFFHYFNYVDYQVLVPDPLRRNSYVCEYLLPLLPNAISTFKVEWFIGTSSFEQGNYKYIMSADSLNLRMNNPASVVNNYRKINYLYKKVHR